MLIDELGGGQLDHSVGRALARGGEEAWDREVNPGERALTLITRWRRIS
jgi:hypothetical protein